MEIEIDEAEQLGRETLRASIANLNIEWIAGLVL